LKSEDGSSSCLDTSYRNSLNRLVMPKHLTSGIRNIQRHLKCRTFVTEWIECSKGKRAQHFEVYIKTYEGDTLLYVDRRNFKNAVIALHNKLCSLSKLFLRDEYAFEE